MRYVAPRAEDILREFTQRNIYDAYEPKPGGWVDEDALPRFVTQTYRRRYAILNNIVSRFEGGELLTTSTAEPNKSILGQRTWGSGDGAFFDLLEAGGGISRMFPRPVIGPAQAYLDTITPELQDLLIEGLDDML